VALDSVAESRRASVPNRTRMTDTLAPQAQQPPYRMAALVVLGTLLLYLVTLAPTTQFWDTSEYIAAAYVLGVPHPPGNPLFTLLAHTWGLVPWFGAYAARINLFAAVTSAIAAGCWFLVGERWLRPVVPATWPRRLAALAGAIVAATAFTVWNQSVVNEKVYTLSVLSIALILWLIVRWDDQPAGQAHDHYLLLIVYLLALTSTNHMMGVLVGPVVLVFLYPPLMQKRAGTDAGRMVEWSQFLVFLTVYGTIVASGLESATPLKLALGLFAAALVFAIYYGNWRFAVATLVVAAIGISVYAYLPIRAGFFPAINEGEPTTKQALWDVLTRAQYGKPSIFDNPMYPPGEGNPGHTLTLYGQQILNYFQYFSWQWGHDWGDRVRVGLTALFGLVGLLGAVRHWAADRRQAIAMTALLFTFTFLLIFYLNFKNGYSQSFGRDLPHEVRERDYFFICSFALWGIWVGMGLATLMEWLQDELVVRVPEVGRRWAMATPVLALAIVPLVGNHLTASRAKETLARDFAYDLLQSVEPYGILVTAGDNDTFPLWYAQEVEHIRQDVTVINLSLANTDWYLRQMQRRPLADFDPAANPAIYRGQTWPKPAGKVLSFTDAELDALQLYYVVEKAQNVNLSGVQVTLDPQRLGKQYIERADVVVLQAIKDNIGKRPIYFSRTVGLYADAFGLSTSLEGQGFARKLHAQPITPSDSIIPVQQLGYLNLPRTTALLFDVYHGDTAARRRPRGWVDRPSEGILSLYGIQYATMADPLRPKNPQLATKALLKADSIFKNTPELGFTPPPEAPSTH
jgi:transmembrane protein TMEM260 (protein O-mannosyltransferase)